MDQHLSIAFSPLLQNVFNPKSFLHSSYWIHAKIHFIYFMLNLISLELSVFQHFFETGSNYLAWLAFKLLCRYDWLQPLRMCWAVMVRAFNPSTWEAEAGRFLSLRPAWSTEWVWGQPGLCRETLLWKTKTNKQTNKTIKQILRTPSASASWVLGLKKLVTMPGCCSTVLHDPLPTYFITWPQIPLVQY